MIDLDVSCSMCGKHKVIPLPVGLVTTETTLGSIMRVAGLIPQQNGAILDVYCSAKCAD